MFCYSLYNSNDNSSYRYTFNTFRSNNTLPGSKPHYLFGIGKQRSYLFLVCNRHW